MSKVNINRPSYKHTKIGWIPEEWYVEDLGQFIKLSSGETRPAYYNEYDLGEDHFPIYGGNGIIGYTHLYNSDSETIIIGRVGEKCGCVYRVSGKVFITDNALYIKQWLKEINPDFVALFLLDFNVSRLRSKGGQPLVSQQPIYKIKLVIPPLPEQQNIAAIISAWDRAIEQTTRLIEAKKKQKKGLMQQLLTGKMRFRQFGKPVGHIGEVPEGWRRYHIIDIANEVMTRNKTSEILPFLSCSKYKGFVNSDDYFSKQTYSKNSSNYKVIKKGQFGFPTNHVEEGSIGYLEHQEKGLLSPIYVVFKVDHDKVDGKYLYCLLKSDLFKHIFGKMTNASVNRRGSLRWNGFSRIAVSLPNLQEQQMISKLNNLLDSEIEILIHNLNQMKNQKQYLLDKLLTGEIRVNFFEYRL